MEREATSESLARGCQLIGGDDRPALPPIGDDRAHGVGGIRVSRYTRGSSGMTGAIHGGPV
jgi:hypothetical protein